MSLPGAPTLNLTLMASRLVDYRPIVHMSSHESLKESRFARVNVPVRVPVLPYIGISAKY